MADNAAQSRDPAAHRAAAVGVVGEDVARLADPARRRGEGAVLRVAEDRHRLALFRVDERQRPRAETRDPQHGDVVARVEGDDDRIVIVPVTAVDPCVLHPGDDMGVRDDELRRRNPAGALDAEAAGGPGHAEDAGSRLFDAGALEEARVGRGDLRQRPADRRERVDALDRVEQPRRRHPLVDLAEDARALHLLAQLCLAGCVQRGRAGDPDDRRTGRRAEHEPAQRVQHAQRGHDEESPADRVARDRRHALDERGPDDRAAERGERRVGRRAPGQELRRELGAEVRAGRDPREREGAGDEPAPKPVQRRQPDHGGRDPVDRRHPFHPTERSRLHCPSPWGRSSVG